MTDFSGLSEEWLRFVEAQALSELNMERFDAAVKARKELIRERERRRRWWHRLFPWTITIERRAI